MFERIIFWEPSASPHKSDFIEALACLMAGVEVICVADQDLLPERRLMGWRLKTPEKHRLVVAPPAEMVSALIDEPKKTLHVFSGIRHVPVIVSALRAVRRRRGHFAIMSEPRVSEGWKGLLRRSQSLLMEGGLRREAAFVLAIGRNGPPWFRSVGYPPEKIFPFAYFVDGEALRPEGSSETGARRIKLGFVGRVTRAKGVEVLVDAMRQCPDAGLSVVGGGDLLEKLRSDCAASTLNVEFLGSRPMAEVPSLMCGFDVLVLPSITTDDGWGVVVSEALLAGTAVVASSCVGASILLDDPLFGVCVTPGRPDEIAAAVMRLRDSDAYSPAAREQRSARAQQILTGAAGAASFKKIVDHCFFRGDRPAPFYQCQEIAK